MKKQLTSYDLNKAKLVHLLKIGLKPKDKLSQPIALEQKAADLWQGLMACPLPLDDFQGSILPGVLADFCQTQGLLTGESLESLLQNPQTDLAMVEVIKTYAKMRSRQSQSEAEHLIANALYYAALAHALIYHQKRITNFVYLDLAHSFDHLRKTEWVGTVFTHLFEKAYHYCLAKQD
ncbi:hypothetical protein ACFL6U_18300 [Planctomycetota bacterium]